MSDQVVADDGLFRRYQPHHLDSQGDLMPEFFQFPKKNEVDKSGPSFLLERLSEPHHALHVDCNDGKPLTGSWGVLHLKVSEIPSPIAADSGKESFFRAVHAPLPTCFAHTELFCSDRPDGTEYVVPPKDVRRLFRIKLSRVLNPVLDFIEL